MWGGPALWGVPGSPPDWRKGRSSSHHSVGLARVDLGEESVLVRWREVVQRMKRILGLKLIHKRARDGGGGGVSVAERRGRRGRSGRGAGGRGRRFASGGRIRGEGGATMCPVRRGRRRFSAARPQRCLDGNGRSCSSTRRLSNRGRWPAGALLGGGR